MKRLSALSIGILFSLVVALPIMAQAPILLAFMRTHRFKSPL